MIKLTVYMMGLGLCAGTHHAVAQGFIRHFDPEQSGKPGAILSVREVPTGYVLFCSQVSNDGTNRTHLFTRMLDWSGLQLSEQELFAGVDRHYVAGPMDPIANCSDGNFAGAIFDIGTGFDMGISLYRFGIAGDTLSTHTILRLTPLDSIGVLASQIRQCDDGGYYMGGSYDPYSPETAWEEALLVRVDPVGDTLWTGRFNPDPLKAYRVLGVVEYVDGGAVMIGYRHGGSVQNDYFVMRTDAQGNEIWTRYFGDDTGANNGAVRLDSDGGIVTWTPYHEDAFPNWYWAQFMLTKWNADGDIVWQKKSHYGDNYDIGDMEVLPDNSIIAVGAHEYGAELMRFNSEGDSLWTRTYLAFATGQAHHLWDVQATSDGGFIAAGSCDQYFGDPTPFLETEWVLKTDSFGCVVPGCQNVGVQEFALDLNELLRIAPNPVRDVLSAELTLPPGTALQGVVRAVLMNAQGQQVQVWPGQRSGDLLSVHGDVSALPRGMYYLHLAAEQRWLAGGKVVVE